MSFIQALVVIVVLTVLRVTIGSLFGGYYYTNVGSAIATILTLGSTILISKGYFSRKNIQFFPTNTVNNKAIVLVVSTTFFLYLATTILGGFEELLREGADGFFQSDFIFGWSNSMTRYFLDVLLVGPILEELFFNGILLQGFLKKYNPVTSIILTTLFFTSFHLGVDDLANWDFVVIDKVSIALSGAFTAWTMIKTSNIKFTIFLHFLWNLLSYLFPLLINVFGIDLSIVSSFFIFSFAVFLISITMLTRNILRLRSDTIFHST